MKHLKIIGLLGFLLWGPTVGIAETVVLPNGETISIVESVQYLADSSATYTPQMVLSPEMESRFLVSTKQSPGFRPDVKTYWLRFSATNKAALDGEWLFNFEGWSFVDFYVVRDGQVEKVFKTGHLTPYLERNYPAGNLNLIHLPMMKADTVECLVRLHSQPDGLIMPTSLNFTVGPRHYVDHQNSSVRRIIGIFLGIMIVMFVYNLFVYSSTRNRSFLYYLGFLAPTIYMTLNNSGYVVSTFYFIESFPKWRGMLESIGSALAAIMMILFLMNILNTREKLPFWHKVLKVFLWAILILTIGNNVNIAIFGPLILLVTFLLMAVFIIVGIRALIKRIPSSGLNLLAYGFSVIGIIILFTTLSGGLPKTNFNLHYAMPLGYTLEMVFYSLALANIINVLKGENEKKQEMIISQLRENELLQTKVNRELEELVAKRTQEIRDQKDIIEREKEKSDSLLLNILPEATAHELKANGKAVAKSFDQVSVLFTDFVGFANISEKMTPEQLVENLDACFKKFDDIATKYNVEKIKTIGDSYMCAIGIPNKDNADPSKIVMAGFEMQEFMAQWNEEKRKRGEPEWQMRVGIHTGPLTAGVVGKKKFSYDIWGDTVNLASRMESSGEPGKINVSEFTMELIKDKFKFVPRGKVQAKNKGMVDMYFVEKP